MDFIQLAKSRKSVRFFKKDDISNNLIMKLIEAAQAAPSAGNCQPWHFYIVKNKDLIRRIRKEACKQDFIENAPVLLIVCADIARSESRYKGRGKGLYYIQDTAAAIQNILLCAHNLGIGACWCGHFDEKLLTNIMNLQDGFRPMAVIPMGYPKKDSPNTERRNIEEIFTFVD
ncbi:nitroreductase family protein [Sedimentibacter sp.]|uniref:nitroreductase family protein n=1 Tax=Sedimentibacter sp. TaxID=1960295 RepID=UPI0028AAD0E8|nr:nitroreductase family protein [Sedimentibacter sp.]